MELRKKSIIYLISIINVISIFFGYTISNLFYLQFIEVGLLIIFIKWEKIRIYPDSKVWLIFLFYIMVTSFFSIDIFVSLRFTLMLLLVYINKLLLDSFGEWKKAIFNFMYYASMVHVIATILQFFFPTVIENINQLILSSNNLNTNLELLSQGAYAGITGQTGVNAFYISIFLILSFIKIAYNDKKILKVLLMILGIIALCLTAKRSFLLFSVILVFAYYIFRKKAPLQKKILQIVMFIAFIILGIQVLDNFGFMDSILNKSETLSEYGDLSNGRNLLWEETGELFLLHPFFGYGIDTIPTIIGEYTHNIYIQVLSELGVFGFIIFICAIIISLVASLKATKNNDMFNDVSLFIQLLFLFYGFTGNPLYGHIFLMPYFLSMSFNKNINREGKENENSNNNISYLT